MFMWFCVSKLETIHRCLLYVLNEGLLLFSDIVNMANEMYTYLFKIHKHPSFLTKKKVHDTNHGIQQLCNYT